MELTTCFSTGFKCEKHENPADFFLDIINLCEKADKNWEKQGKERSWLGFFLCVLLARYHTLLVWPKCTHILF